MGADVPALEVRLLGGLRVVRADGSVVAPDAWRTAKTRDLLRILALENGHAVRLASLTDLLWPDVVPSRARGSLRSAASRIRTAVGFDCIRREQDDLRLVSAVVDVDVYRGLVAAARQAAARHADDETVLLAQAAETVYLGDFHASDDDTGWAVRARADLRQLRLAVLTDATAGALATGHGREALDLARSAVRLAPSSETASRHLMRAHAAVGEIGEALRVFEAHRARLAAELGVRPSPETRDLYLRLLQDGDP